jgi:hypothetical protein
MIKLKTKCPGCGVKTLKEKLDTELRMETLDGVVSVFVCESCANFWDKSADILNRRNTTDGTDQSV